LEVKVKAAALTVVAIAAVLAAASLAPSVIPPPWYVVASRSMEPALHVGDLVIALPASPSDIKVGDVVIYRSPEGKLIIHRVIDRRVVAGEYRYLTKGDNNAMPDQDPRNPYTWVPEDRVLAKVMLSIPLLGYPFLSHVKPLTEAILIAALAFLVYKSLAGEGRGLAKRR